MKIKDSRDLSKKSPPKDYTDDLYKVYFEVGEYKGRAKKVLENYLGADQKGKIKILSHGYVVEIAMQCIPDIIGGLIAENIAIYQVNRYTKIDGSWQSTILKKDLIV